MDAILTNLLLPNGDRGEIAIKAGRIAAIGLGLAGGPRRDMGGLLALPGLVDGHMHLDKTLMGTKWMGHQAAPNRMSRIETDKKIWPTLDKNDEERATALIELCVARGSSWIRTHVDIDLENRLTKLHGVLRARERWKDHVSIQIVAFPQSGVTRCPGVLDLLDQAIGDGADLVGGIDPCEIDRDPKGQLDGIFKVAGKRGVGIDIHLHEPGEMGQFNVEEICARTTAAGMNGKVTISHGFSLGTGTETRQKALAERMAKAGVSLVTHGAAGWTMPPLGVLREAGVECFAGNDDVRDTWSPYGTADMLERAMIIGWRLDWRHDHMLMDMLDIVSTAGTRAMGVGPHGLVIGAPADLCFVAAENAPAAVGGVPPRALVLKRGKIVARDGSMLASPASI